MEDTTRFLPWLRERVAAGDITRIAPTTDLIAYYSSVLREDFPPDVRRTIAPLAEIEQALIKSRFSAACVRLGQAVPETRTPDSLEGALAAAAELGYPLILKPKSHIAVGTAERGGLIYSEEELRARFHSYEAMPGQESLAERYPELRWPLLQRYIHSARRQVFSVTGLKDPDSGIVTAAVSYKREQWPPDVGTSVTQISLRNERVLEAGLQTVDGLISRGIFELELVVDGVQLLAIDLNPRAFGFINLDIATGHDLPWLWFRSTLGQVVREAEPARRVSMEARHVLLYLLKRMVEWRVRGPRPPVERRDRSRPREWMSIMGWPRDPLPLLISHARVLRHPRSLIRSLLATARDPRATDVKADARPQELQ